MDLQAQRVLQEFVEGLKEAYKERQLSCEEQWPPVRGDRLIKLQLVEANKTEGFRASLSQHGAHDDKVKRTPILHGDLFEIKKGKKPVRKLIVEGNAGIGKTTLCTMLTEEWANGEILTQFDCVLLLPLRDQLVSSASSLSDLLPLYHPDETVCGSVVQQLKRTRGKGVLIIADGWDELSEEKRSKTSFIYNLLFGRLLPSASVLLTSRPAASAPLHHLPTVDRLVEVVGFNEENVKQFIESEFAEKASSLIEQLENNPLITSVCSVPLNCAIVCHLWYTLKGVLPRTLTELYAKITLAVILRNHKKYFNEFPISLSSFDSIPVDLQYLFWLACKFAFECLSNDQIVFLEDEMASSFQKVLYPNDKFLCFGLLQCARSLLPVGQGLSFHFVHLTIQEFLAALHLVTLPNEEKLKVCEFHAENVRFAMVWKFMFGLGCQKEGSYSRKVICLDDKLVGQFLDNHVGQINLLCHCALESLNNEVSVRVGKQIDGKFEGCFASIATTPHDCSTVFHVLSHYPSCFNITINLSDCGLTDKLLMNLANILSSGELKVRELSLYGNKITDNGITDLFNRASASFSSLWDIDLSSNSITDISSLFSSCNSVKYLYLSENPLRVSGIQSLETAVQAGVLVSLEWLYLSNTLTDDADINGALLATLSPSLASHCPHLKDFDLSINSLGLPGTNALVELITSSSRGKIFLDLSDTNINAEAALALTLSTKHCKNSRACKFDLKNNPLGYDGLLTIFEMLRSETCSITELYLDNTSTDIDSPFNTESLFHNLSLSPVLESSKLTLLSLSYNNFSGENVLILAECARVCKSLERLHCSHCSLTSSELIKITNHLKSNNSRKLKLRDWILSDNSIDDVGVNALIESAPELLPCLKFVSLLRNPVSGEVNERLTEMLKVQEV